ncbi:MAG: hypothetical protein AAF378_09095 [Cyanobacteria bacterium P01_A01_bin.84]
MSKNLFAIVTLISTGILAANISIAKEKQPINSLNKSIEQHHVQLKGSGVITHKIGNIVAAQRLERGQYEVSFGRDMSQCIFNATVANSGSSTLIVVSNRFNNPKAAFIKTINSTNGIVTNKGFNLSAFCPS